MTSSAFSRLTRRQAASDEAVQVRWTRRLEDARRIPPLRTASAGIAADEADSLALVSLYETLSGNFWTTNTNWLSGPVATWHGSRLNAEGRVTRIDLRQNELIGFPPDALGTLTALDTLQLADAGSHRCGVHRLEMRIARCSCCFPFLQLRLFP